MMTDISCQEARLAVRLRGCLLDKGVPPHDLGLISDVRNQYLSRVGAKRYLSEMLGEDSTRGMYSVILRYPDGSIMYGDGETGEQTLLRYLAGIEPESWPYAIRELGSQAKNALKYI